MEVLVERLARHALLGCVLAVLAVHLPVFTAYGIHRDEMYFVECGRHLAAGYVDHPPLVPLLARIACGLGDCSVGALRLAPLLARVLTVALTVLLVRRLGGRGFAQGVAGLAVILAPAFLRMGKLLCIPVFEPVFWTAGTMVLLALARGASPRWWLAIGAIAGVGLLNKHTMLVWGLGAAVGTIFVPELRAALRTRWPWLGVLLAFALATPNVVWQMRNDFATVEFLRMAQAGMLAQIPRALFLAGQLLYMHPFAALLWVPALWSAATRKDPAGRIFGAAFVVGLATFLVTRGKPYYLSPAYPALFALGAVMWERRVQRVVSRAAFLALQVATGAAIALLSLPYLPLGTIDAIVARVLGGVVPPIALTGDLHDEVGWKEQTEIVAGVWRSLAPDDRANAEIVTANYGEAAALDRFGAAVGLPAASSNHMTFFLWGPNNPKATTLVAVGLPQRWLGRHCTEQREAARFDHPLVTPFERGLPVVVCRLAHPIGELWPSLKSYDNGWSTAELNR